MQQVSQTGLDLIKEYEGFEPDAYWCDGGKLTIGYGTTTYEKGIPVQLGDTISHEDAEKYLKLHLMETVEPAIAHIFNGREFEQHQFDAIASFVYNLGPNWDPAWKTLKRLIEEKMPDQDIADQWQKYHNAGGKPLLGLYRRRLSEISLWHKHAWRPAMQATFKETWHNYVPVAPEAPVAPPKPKYTYEETEPAPPVVEIKQPDPAPEAKPVSETKPIKPLDKVDPALEPKEMVLSKTFWGNILIMLGWLTAFDFVQVPFLESLVQMTPAQVSAFTEFAPLMTGFLLRWYGQVTAKRAKL